MPLFQAFRKHLFQLLHNVDVKNHRVMQELLPLLAQSDIDSNSLQQLRNETDTVAGKNISLSSSLPEL
ncbi:MAG: hypothetical protein ABI861_11145 [Panacibacter sp.]